MFACKNNINSDNQYTSEPVAYVKQAKNIEGFIPTGMELLDSVSGFLNQDKIRDYIIVLKRKNEKSYVNDDENEPKRVVLILAGNNNNTFSLIAQNSNTLYLFYHGGMLGDPYNGIKIDSAGYFTLYHHGGCSLQWDYNITYYYDYEENACFIFRTLSFSYLADLDDGLVRQDLKTKYYYGKMRFEDYNIFNDN